MRSAPDVSVFLWHQCENNAPYFQQTVKSLFYQKTPSDVFFETICVAGTKERPVLDLEHTPENFTLIHMPNAVTVSEKFEIAMMHAHPESTHILLLSDDIVCSQALVYNLYQSFNGREAIINPMSNSDCRSLYEADLPYFDRKKLKPDMTIEDFTPDELDSLIDYHPCGNQACYLLVPFMTLSFFCTMIPKSVFAKVGALDPALEHRHNDQDFCMRAHSLGVPAMVQFGAFAFHFGSRTIRQLATHESQAKATEHFKRKWGL